MGFSLCQHLSCQQVPCLPYRLLNRLDVVLGGGLGLLVLKDGLHFLEAA
jgi:hypothetical protein